MGLVIGIKFTLDSGDVDFYKEEVANIQLLPNREIQIQEPQKGLPNLYLASDVYNVIRITFVEYFSTTLDKIKQIYNENDIMTLYYQYSYSPTTSKSVILFPEEMVKTYSLGEHAKTSHTFNFLEV